MASRYEHNRKRHLALVMGILVEQYVYTHDSRTKAEINRLKAELAGTDKRHAHDNISATPPRLRRPYRTWVKLSLVAIFLSIFILVPARS